MPLSPADLVLVYRDTLRGLEADKARAEVLAAGDEYQASRIEVLDKQIAAAEEKLAAAESEAATQEAQRLHDFVVANAPDDGYDDGYGKFKKADFAKEFARRGIVYDAADTVPVLTDKLRAWDLHHTGVAVAAGVTPGV